MALFGSKKKKDDAKAETSSEVSTVNTSADLAHVIRHARITEKATMHIEGGCYVFNVADSASKKDIAAAVKKIYSVTPAKVRVATVPSKTKRSMRTGRTGTKSGGKKAYVYLRKGDSINL